MRTCPVCATENEPGAAHCEVCGERLTPLQPGEQADESEMVAATLQQATVSAEAQGQAGDEALERPLSNEESLQEEITQGPPKVLYSSHDGTAYPASSIEFQEGIGPLGEPLVARPPDVAAAHDPEKGPDSERTPGVDEALAMDPLQDPATFGGLTTDHTTDADTPTGIGAESFEPISHHHPQGETERVVTEAERAAAEGVAPEDLHEDLFNHQAHDDRLADPSPRMDDSSAGAFSQAAAQGVQDQMGGFANEFDEDEDDLGGGGGGATKRRRQPSFEVQAVPRREPIEPLPTPGPSAQSATVTLYVDRQPVMTHAIDSDETLIGRQDAASDAYPEVDLAEWDPDASVSRKHAYIYRQNKNYTLYVVSNAGTQINEDLLELGDRRTLSDGDVIVLAGRFAMKFERP